MAEQCEQPKQPKIIQIVKTPNDVSNYLYGLGDNGVLYIVDLSVDFSRRVWIEHAPPLMIEKSLSQRDVY